MNSILITNLAEMITDEHVTTDNIQTVVMTDHSGQISHEYHASDPIQATKSENPKDNVEYQVGSNHVA